MLQHNILDSLAHLHFPEFINQARSIDSYLVSARLVKYLLGAVTFNELKFYT